MFDTRHILNLIMPNVKENQQAQRFSIVHELTNKIEFNSLCIYPKI
jgi:hypothetical protein